LAIEITMINLKNKKGGIELKDILVMLLLFSGIIALASIFVQEIGDPYDNVNMTSYTQDTLGKDNLSSTSRTFSDLGQEMAGGGVGAFFATLEGVWRIFTTVLKAPITFVSMFTTILEDTGLVESEGIITTLTLILSGILYVVIIFAIAAAIMQRSSPI